VAFVVEQRRSGRRAGRRCVRQTRANRRKRRCRSYVRAGAFAAQASEGSNTKRFSGRIGAKILRPGPYRATLTATDPAGNRSRPVQITFTVLRR